MWCGLCQLSSSLPSSIPQISENSPCRACLVLIRQRPWSTKVLRFVEWPSSIKSSYYGFKTSVSVPEVSLPEYEGVMHPADELLEVGYRASELRLRGQIDGHSLYPLTWSTKGPNTFEPSSIGNRTMDPSTLLVSVSPTLQSALWKLSWSGPMRQSPQSAP